MWAKIREEPSTSKIISLIKSTWKSWALRYRESNKQSTANANQQTKSEELTKNTDFDRIPLLHQMMSKLHQQIIDYFL